MARATTRKPGSRTRGQIDEPVQAAGRAAARKSRTSSAAASPSPLEPEFVAADGGRVWEDSDRDGVLPYDPYLLERSSTQWQFGDWHSLARLNRDALHRHPERAKLMLLAAAAHLQQGDASKARKFVRQAIEWGCPRKVITQVMVSGAHNSLARASLLAGLGERAIGHFELAMSTGTPGNYHALLSQARVIQQISQLRQQNPAALSEPLRQELAASSACDVLGFLGLDKPVAIESTPILPVATTGRQPSAALPGVLVDNRLQQIAMVAANITAKARCVIDVGCADGLVSLALADLFLDVTGYESSDAQFGLASSIADTVHVTVRLVNQPMTVDVLRSLPEVDVVIYLGEHHRRVAREGLDVANALLAELFRKAKYQLFFAASVEHRHYGTSMPFSDGNVRGMQQYFTKLLNEQDAGLHGTKVLGFAKAEADSDALAPMLAFNKEPIGMANNPVSALLRNAGNRAEFGRNAPFHAARIWVRTSELSQIIDKGLFSRLDSGRVVDGDWCDRVSPLEHNFKVQCAHKHWANGLDWEATGVFELLEAVIAENGQADGCRTRDELVARHAELDRIFEVVRQEGRLRTTDELSKVPKGEAGGVYVHLGRNGRLIFGGGGHHRLVMARVLGIDLIPAQIGCVHPSAVERFRSLRMAR